MNAAIIVPSDISPFRNKSVESGSDSSGAQTLTDIWRLMGEEARLCHPDRLFLFFPTVFQLLFSCLVNRCVATYPAQLLSPWMARRRGDGKKKKKKTWHCVIILLPPFCAQLKVKNCTKISIWTQEDVTVCLKMNVDTCIYLNSTFLN